MEERKEFTLTITEEDLEVLIRGAKKMYRKYKSQYAEANTTDDENKYIERAFTASELVRMMESLLNPKTDSKWALYIVSDGGIQSLFEGGFDTEEAAIEKAEFYGWKYKDNNDFVWSIVVEEEN